MANSDNVLRGGLTSKHIDLPELLRVVDFEPRAISLLAAEEVSRNEKVFINPAREFDLALISVSTAHPYNSSNDRSAEILFCTDGELEIRDTGTETILKLNKGDSAIVPAAVHGYELHGNAVLYKAAVPLTQMASDE
jgi:mannose-6-phosphate isomerase